MTPFNEAIVKWIRLGFTFSGRSTRADFWWPLLLVVIVQTTLLSLFASGSGMVWLEALVEWSEGGSNDLAELDLPKLGALSRFAGVFLVVFGLLTFFPNLAVSWRRFHDLGKPGWFHLLFLFARAVLPFAVLAELVWFIAPGERRDNRYGPDPLDARPDIFD